MTKSLRNNLLLALLIILWTAACSPASPAITSSEALQIQPGVGIGSIKLGMPMEEVSTIVGKPDRMTGSAMEYLELGFAVLSGHGETVGAIMIGDSAGGDLSKAFKGKTSEGIGMGSSEQEIQDAFGEPAPALTPPEKLMVVEGEKQGSKTLRYPDRSLTFVLRENRLVHITLR